MPKLRIPRPTFSESSADEFVSVIDGTFFNDRKYNQWLAHGQVKYLGALWMSAMARKHPDLRFITMSPGGTSGTDGARDQPLLVRTVGARIVLPYIAPLSGSGTNLRKARSGTSTGSPTPRSPTAPSTSADRT